ncbi:acyl-CoA thioesterase [Pseudomonas aeruginosa]
MSSEPELKDFPIHSSDKIRYADTDRQGHVNNAVFATFLETGRVEIIYDPEIALARPGSECVIARLELDLRGELRWPGTVQIVLPGALGGAQFVPSRTGLVPGRPLRGASGNGDRPDR